MVPRRRANDAASSLRGFTHPFGFVSGCLLARHLSREFCCLEIVLGAFLLLEIVLPVPLLPLLWRPGNVCGGEQLLLALLRQLVVTLELRL